MRGCATVAIASANSWRPPPTLGPKLGALLFQLPPNLKKDLPLLDAFLDTFPPRVCAAFEFRHTSWLDDEVYARLRAQNLALCVADSEKLSTPVEITADYAYFRLRDEGYGPDDIARWAETIREQDGALRRRIRLLQARGRRQRAGVRADADGAAKVLNR